MSTKLALGTPPRGHSITAAERPPDLRGSGGHQHDSDLSPAVERFDMQLNGPSYWILNVAIQNGGVKMVAPRYFELEIGDECCPFVARG